MIKLLTFSIERLLSLLKEACHKETNNWTERKQYPETDDLVTSIERDEIVAYLLEVCQREDMSFSVDTFSLFVILLDRFLSSYKVKSKYLECLAVACLYIASKVKEEDENISITSEFLMDCDAKCSISELLRMEQMILTKFEWNVNQTTHVDFLNIFYAILVNKYQEIEVKLNNEITTKKVNIWKYKHAKSFKLDTSSASSDMPIVNKSLPNSSYPPVDLDFLDTLHSHLKQLLCIDELTSSFRPHMLAYCLLSNHIEKTIVDNQHINMIYKEALMQTLNSAKIYSKLIDEDILDICKEKIKYHLSSIETSNSLFDQYLSEYHSGIVNSFRTSLSVVNTDLPAIKEEDEEIEQDNCVTSKNNNNTILRNISNCMQNDSNNEMDISSSSSSSSFENNVNNNNNDTIDKDDIDNGLNRFDQYKKKIMMLTHHQDAKGLTYADILIGRTRTDGTCICEQQKRKLSENSSVGDDDEIKQDYCNEDENEDYDYDYDETEGYYENEPDDNDFDYASNEVRFN